MGETVLRLEELPRSCGETVALHGVSFDLGADQLFAFLGPNGAGKTTLMRIVPGVLAAGSGEVLWRGGPIDAEARRRIGYMPEERGLDPKMRVRDQLVYMARLQGASEADAPPPPAAGWSRPGAGRPGRRPRSVPRGRPRCVPGGRDAIPAGAAVRDASRASGIRPRPARSS